MSTRKDFANRLTNAFLSCDWMPEAMEQAGQAALGDVPKDLLSTLVREVQDQTVTPYAPPPRKLTRYIFDSAVFGELHAQAKKTAQGAPGVRAPARMAPLAVFEQALIPQLPTPSALAEWLEIPAIKLDWFADIAGRLAHGADDRLRHYVYSWAPKRHGPPRLIEAPKADLKRIQRKILREILDLVPPHDCAHGFTKGRSCITSAQRHAGERIVVAIDLKEYFPSVRLAKVHGLFRCLGYPWTVARLLTGLCSATTPRSIFEQLPSANAYDWNTRTLYQTPHLPQGAPTSPALANLCSWRLDCRLSGLARHMNARYTRYADDLAFSGDDELAEQTGALIRCVTSIVKEEGFVPNPRKTRIMRQGQRQYLTGLVINQHINVFRTQSDALKATLHNCAQFGPKAQNREQHPEFRSHLDGRITWIENVNPHRGHKLRVLFDKIDWT